MILRNYQVAEEIEAGEEGVLLTLDIPLDLRDENAVIGWNAEPGDLQAMQQTWLKATNDTLNDDDPLNDTSYNTSLLYKTATTTRMTTLSLYGLEVNQPYELFLLFYGGDTKGRLQISGVGKSLQYKSASNLIVPEKQPLKFRRIFVSWRKSARIEILNQNMEGIVYLLGISVQKKAFSGDSKNHNGKQP